MNEKETYQELQNKIKELESQVQQNKKDHQELIRLRSIVENVPVAIGISDPEGNHYYHNDSFTKLFGYEIEAFASMSPKELYCNLDDAEEIFLEHHARHFLVRGN